MAIGGTVVALPIGMLTNTFLSEKSDEGKDSLATIRENHQKLMNQNPFVETVQLSRKDRKAMGLPPNAYHEQMWKLTMNPYTGKTEPENILNVQEKLSLQKSAPGDSKDNPWEERGPNNIGGRTRVMMFDPNDSSNKRVYAGGVSGGLWVNDDITSASSKWVRVKKVPGNLSVTSITVDPKDSNTWYVGTGEQYTAGDVVGSGVYKTVDGGTTWKAVKIPPAGPATNSYSENNLFLSGIYYVNDVIAWENKDKNRTELFVGIGAHIYGDASSPRNWLGLQTAGLYRSIDGGTTWKRIESSNMEFEFKTNSDSDDDDTISYYYIPNDFEISADNTLWMGTITTPGIGGNGGGRVFSSTDGSTWSEAAASPLNDANRVELEPSSQDANKLYALVQGVQSGPVHIYKTTNKFQTTTTVSLPNDADAGIPANDFTRGQSFYDLMIEVDPKNDNIVYVGGIDLFRSSNSGNTWSQISKWSNNRTLAQLSCSLVHADQHAMTFRPGNTNQAVFGNDGGIYYASNLSGAANSNSIHARNSNFNVTQYVKTGIGPNGVNATDVIFTAGAQDNGSQAFRGQNASPGINGAEELSDGDGFYTFVDKDGEYMIATYTNNTIYRYNLPWDGRGRRQGGATQLSSERTGSFVNEMGYDNDADFIVSNATVVNQDNSRNYAIKTIDVARNSNRDITNSVLNSTPTAFVASPFSDNEWLIGLANGRLLRLTNVAVGRANWSIVDTPFVGSVSSIRFGKTKNDLFVTMHNYGVKSVWYSKDGGANWLSKEGDLPNIPVRDILQNPLDLNEVIIGTQLGVWVTKNFNETDPKWVRSQNGMQDVSVTSFDYWERNGDVNDNIIIASTYGRGVFTGSFGDNKDNDDKENPTAPTNLKASNITQTSVQLEWNASTDNVGVKSYEIYQEDKKIANSSNTTYEVTNLNASTEYEFYVVANDSAGNVSEKSNLVRVTTKEAVSDPNDCITVFKKTHKQGFERNGLKAWVQATNDDKDWVRRQNSTPSEGTGPSSAQHKSWYLYLEATTDGNNASTAIINTPCYDFSGESVGVLTFQYHMNGNDVGSLTVEATTDNGTTWEQIWTETGSQGNSWKKASVDLKDYTNKNVKLRFIGRAKGWQGDIAIDRFKVAFSKSRTADTLAGVVEGTPEETSSEFTIYPNPISGNMLSIQSSVKGVLNYSLLNLRGQLVTQGEVVNGQINVQQLAKGIYILKLKGEGFETKINKLVKK